jgi:membrane protein
MKRKVISSFRFVFQVLKEYFADNVIKYSASLAYYTVLSLAPLLVIIISVSSILYGKAAMEGDLYKQLNGMVGNEAAIQLQSTIQNVHLSKDSPVATIVSLVVLLIGATGIFGEIQDSLNKIWGLKTTSHKAWWKLILNRLISFSLIISLGFVMMVSLVLYAIVEAVSGRFNSVITGAGDTMLPVVNHLLSVVISTLMFATIFKVLPDAKIKWKDVFVGAFITAILFTLGKFAIGFYLGKSVFASVFGAAGSVIIIMIWVYYSSAILYLGAVFTKVYAVNFGGKIHPNKYATWIIEQKVPVSEPTLAE